MKRTFPFQANVSIHFFNQGSISASSMRSAWSLKESPFHSYDSPKQVSRAHPSFYSQEDPSASYPHPTTRSYVPRKEPVLKSSLSSVSAFGPQSTAVYPRYIGVKVYIKTKSGGRLESFSTFVLET